MNNKLASIINYTFNVLDAAVGKVGEDDNPVSIKFNELHKISNIFQLLPQSFYRTS